MIMQNQNIAKKLNCVKWIKTVSLYTQKQMIFVITLQKMLKLDRPLPKGKNKKVIQLMKNELSGKIVIKFVGLRAKSYSYLIDDGSEGKKAKNTKNFVIKGNFKFENYKNSLETTQFDNKTKYSI